MSEVRVIQINESVFAENDRAAERIRRQMTDQGTFFLNVMSSPGSGKTTTLVALINRLKDRLKIGEMDVDIRSSLDAQRVSDLTGVSAIQIHNGGLCHIDADMTARALMAYDTAGLDLLIPKRERRIKGSRFKIANDKGGFHYNPDAPIHNYKVEFRWATVRTLVNEILGGLVDE